MQRLFRRLTASSLFVALASLVYALTTIPAGVFPQVDEIYGEAHAAGPVCLEVDGVYGAVETAHDVVAGDFNEDGKLDLAVLAHRTDSPEAALVVLLGDGTGGFSPFVSLPAGNHNHGVITADLNHDGHLDLAATTADATNPTAETNVIQTYLGDGTGGFPTHRLWKVERSGLGPLDVQAADLNKDSHLDLVAVGAGGEVAVLLGNGSGNFGTPKFFSNPSTRSRSSVIADFNKDGKLDVVVANRVGNTVSLLLGDGAGNLSFSRSFRTGFGPRTVIAEDFNGDGNLDIAVTCRERDAVAVLLGNGAGMFSSARLFPVGRDPRAIRAGDFNNDGLLDLAVANSLSQTVSLLFGNGQGNFSAASNIPVGNAPVRKVSRTGEEQAGDGIVGLESGDVNKDGKTDLLVTSTFDGQLYVLLNHCPSAP